MRDGGLHPRSSEDPRGVQTRLPYPYTGPACPLPTRPSPGLGPGSHVGSGCGGHARGWGGARGLSVLTGGPGRPLPCNAKHGVRACLGREEVAQHPPRPPELSGELLGMRRRSPDST